MSKTYWQHRHTPQFKSIIYELTQAKQDGSNRTIVAESGAGKSYAISLFCKTHPESTYVIKCFREDTLGDLLRKIEGTMGLSGQGSSSQRLDRIALEFYRNRDVHPVLVIDESESLTIRSFGMLKALYDALDLSKGIVLVGTPDLLDIMDRAKKSHKPGMPQFARRFKAGIRHIARIDQKYNDFLDDLKLPTSFRKLISSVCDNYGELHDYMEPAMRRADELGVEFNEEFFKSYHLI